MEVKDFLGKPDKSIISVGQALTNDCDMNCPHCYSRKYSREKVGIKECELVLRAFPSIKEINFGTGETYLNSDFVNIFRFYKEKGICLALTTNGNTLMAMTDEEIAAYLSDVDISLDFPRPELHNAWRNHKAFENAILGVERAKSAGVNMSIALALTNKNYRYLPEFARILDKYDIFLRINIYKPIHSNEFSLSYEQFWEAIKLMADNFGMMGSSEPILALVLDDNIRGSPCGHSLRIHTDLSVSGCVYLSNEAIETKEFIKLSKKIPDFCKECSVVKRCRGGCLSRRILQCSAFSPDVYCPMANNKEVPEIKFRRSRAQNLVHLNYLCTTLLSRRFL